MKIESKRNAATAIAWDPSSPASLLIAPDSKNINVTLSSNGLGCSPEEITALLELLDARDRFENHFEDFFHMDDRTRLSHLYYLSTEYIQHVHTCITEWSDRISMQNSTLETENQNLSFLMQMHSIMHLSCIYLLSPQFSISDIVRFLRHHFVPNPLDDFSSDSMNIDGGVQNSNTNAIDPMDEMLSSSQPEYYQGGRPYWTLVERFIKRGMLKDAWAVLSNHSVCRGCTRNMSHASEEEEDVEQTRRGFSHIYALLHSAPIPGGRSADNDIGYNQSNNDPLSGGMEQDDDNTILLDSVPASAYKYWESEETSPAAFSHWMTWNTAVQSALQNGIEGGLHRRIPQLMTSVLSILAGYHSQQRKKESKEMIWAEVLLQEILFARPNITSYDVCQRANAAMRAVRKDSDNSTPKGLENIVLSVMRGDAGRAIEATHILGGGSGAALPSTMCALLCDLFTHANLLPPRDSNAVNNHLELLLSASSACQSSFAATPTGSLSQKFQYKHIGVQCAVRLLRYSHHLRGIATIAEITSTLDQSMSSDRETTTLLKYCDFNFTELEDDHGLHVQNRRHGLLLLQDCVVNICHSRASFHLHNSRPSGATYWGLKCVQFEMKGFTDTSEIGNSRGKRFLERLCSNAASDLLNLVSLVFECCTSDDLSSEGKYGEILEKNDIVTHCLTYANEIWSTIENETNEGLASVLQHLSEDNVTTLKISLLKNMIKMTNGFMKQNDADVIKAIVECLKQSDSGSCYSVASIAMFRKLLVLAHTILLRQEEQSFDNVDNCAINVEDVYVFLASLALLDDSEALLESMKHSFFTTAKMRLFLGKAEMNAFVAKNKKKGRSKDEERGMKLSHQNAPDKSEQNLTESIERTLLYSRCVL